MRVHSLLSSGCQSFYRGTKPRRQVGLKAKKCKYFHVRASSGCSIGIYKCERSTFGASDMSFSGHSHAGILNNNKEQETFSA